VITTTTSTPAMETLSRERHHRGYFLAEPDGFLSPTRSSLGTETVPTYRPGDIRKIGNGEVVIAYGNPGAILAQTADVSRRTECAQLQADIAAVRRNHRTIRPGWLSHRAPRRAASGEHQQTCALQVILSAAQRAPAGAAPFVGATHPVLAQVDSCSGGSVASSTGTPSTRPVLPTKERRLAADTSEPCHPR
jgi:hypothetical protein